MLIFTFDGISVKMDGLFEIECADDSVTAMIRAIRKEMISEHMFGPHDHEMVMGSCGLLFDRLKETYGDRVQFTNYFEKVEDEDEDED